MGKDATNNKSDVIGAANLIEQPGHNKVTTFPHSVGNKLNNLNGTQGLYRGILEWCSRNLQTTKVASRPSPAAYATIAPSAPPPPPRHQSPHTTACQPPSTRCRDSQHNQGIHACVADLGKAGRITALIVLSPTWLSHYTYKATPPPPPPSPPPLYPCNSDAIKTSY